MQCDICRERPAVIFVQQVSRGSSVELHMCEQCAKERGYKIREDRIDISLGGLFSEALSGDRKKEPVPACPECSTTLEDIRRRKLAGCAACYREFRAEINALMRAEGFEAGYAGALPKKLEAFKPSPPDPENLRKELQRAIDAEDYELAAYYRDRIRALGGNS